MSLRPSSVITCQHRINEFTIRAWCGWMLSQAVSSSSSLSCWSSCHPSRSELNPSKQEQDNPLHVTYIQLPLLIDPARYYTRYYRCYITLSPTSHFSCPCMCVINHPFYAAANSRLIIMTFNEFCCIVNLSHRLRHCAHEQERWLQ